MSLKLEIEAVMLNAEERGIQCKTIGDIGDWCRCFNGRVVEGNRGNEEELATYGVKERNERSSGVNWIKCIV